MPKAPCPLLSLPTTETLRVAAQLFAGAGNQVLVYDVNTGGIIHTQGGHASAVVGVSLFSGFLISASDDGKIGLLGYLPLPSKYCPSRAEVEQPNIRADTIASIAERNQFRALLR